MEYINKVEIAGIIGNIKTMKVYNTTAIILTVATNEVFKRENDVVVETTWHNVSYFSKPTDNLNMDKLIKGQGVHVKGRLKNHRFTDAQGIEHTSFDIVANNLELINA